MGQNCIGIERLIVHADQYDDLYAIFQERVSKLRVGSVMSPQQAGFMSIVDGGAMINNNRFNGIENLIKEAVDGNAYLIGGSEFQNHPYHPHGYFFQPTVVGPVDKSMGIAQQERKSFLQFMWIMSSIFTAGFSSICSCCCPDALRYN
jgi:acyl-CoA reductase-like NAD-dependent aldehyde dehydrogenase